MQVQLFACDSVYIDDYAVVCNILFGVVDFEIFHNTVDILIDSFCVV